MTKTAIIIGSTGLTGSHLLDILLKSDRYKEVITFVRRNTNRQHPKLTEHVIDFDKAESYQSLVKGDDLFCCLGTTIKKAGSQEAFQKVDLEYPVNFAKIAAKNEMSMLLAISAIGAKEESNNFYIRTKGSMENQLKSIFPKSVGILRPSLIVGDRGEFRLGEEVASFFMRIFSPLLVGKLRKYRYIHGKNLAQGMYNIAQLDVTGFQIYESDKIAQLAKQKP